MSVMPRLTDQLVARSVLVALLMTWLLMLGFDLLLALAEELGDLGSDGPDPAAVFVAILYTLPRRAYDLFPTAALIGSVVGLGGLAANSELTALRAAGIPRWRISAAAATAVLLLTAVMMISAETLGPAGDERAQSLMIAAQSDDLALARGSGIWAREGEVFINARRAGLRGTGTDTHVELGEVTLYEFEDNGRLQSISQVERAEHRDGNWTLFEIERTRFLPDRVEVEQIAQQDWASALNPELLSLSIARPRYLSFLDLREGLEYQRRNALDTGPFESAYWARLFYPLNVLVLCVAVMPFAFGSLRSGGFGKRLFIGICFGLGFYLVQRLSVNMAEVYRIDLRLAHILPALLLGGWSGFYFARR